MNPFSFFHLNKQTNCTHDSKLYKKKQIPSLDSRFNDDDDYVPPAPPRQDYRSFFDFGYFSDLAATISNAPNPQTQSGYGIQIRKQKTPNTVELEKIITPDLSKKTDATKKVDDFF